MKNLKLLLVIHAIVTFAAAVVLIVEPSLIPKTVNIEVNHDQYLLSYFLGAAELGIAYLSFQSRNIKDKYALKIIIISFIVFHSSTGVLEVYGLLQGTDFKIIGNILLRAVISILFYYFGVYKINRQGDNFIKCIDQSL